MWHFQLKARWPRKFGFFSKKSWGIYCCSPIYIHLFALTFATFEVTVVLKSLVLDTLFASRFQVGSRHRRIVSWCWVGVFQRSFEIVTIWFVDQPSHSDENHLPHFWRRQLGFSCHVPNRFLLACETSVGCFLHLLKGGKQKLLRKRLDDVFNLFKDSCCYFSCTCLRLQIRICRRCQTLNQKIRELNVCHPFLGCNLW